MKRESATTTETTWKCGKIISNDKKIRVQTQENDIIWEEEPHSLNFTHLILIAFEN